MFKAGDKVRRVSHFSSAWVDATIEQVQGPRGNYTVAEVLDVGGGQSITIVGVLGSWHSVNFNLASTLYDDAEAARLYDAAQQLYKAVNSALADHAAAVHAYNSYIENQPVRRTPLAGWYEDEDDL